MPTRCNQYIYVMFYIKIFSSSKKEPRFYFSHKKKEKEKGKKTTFEQQPRWTHKCRSRPRQKRLLYIYFHEILLIAETSGLLCAYEELKRDHIKITQEN
jgi:hypothetical protein